MSQTEAAPKRRLSAILIADVVGYSRMMELDDAGTFGRHRTLRAEVIDPAIAASDGRIVKSTGDGVLAEFSSAVAALQAAIAIPRDMASRNAHCPADRKLEFRIGLNVGDIIVDGDDIAGDGVNVAARLEALAEPGGTCVSAAVREQVHNDLGVEFIDIGEQEVKNIARPIGVFRVRPAGVAYRPSPSLSVRRPRRWTARHAWAAGTVALGIAALGLWIVFSGGTVTSGEERPGALLVAVLPFASESADEASRVAAAEVSRELAAAIAQDRWFKVAAPGKAAEYRDKVVNPRLAAERLQVRYLVDGEATRAALTVRLIEAESGRQLWSERFEWPKSAPQTDMVRVDARLPMHLNRALYDAGRDAVARDGNPRDPIDYVLLGWRAARGPGAPAIAEARKHFAEALRIDPNFVPALAFDAQAVWQEFFHDTSRKQRAAEDMLRLTGRAITLDHRDAFGWEMRASALAMSSRWEESLAAIERARTLVPWDTRNVTSAAILHWLAGRAEEGEGLQLRAIEMDPPGGAYEFRHLCFVRLLLGRYAQAVESCERAGGLDQWYEDQLWLVAAYAQKGDMAKAARARAVLDKQQPGVTIENSLIRHISDHPVYVQQLETHVYPGLRKAGVPEC